MATRSKPVLICFHDVDAGALGDLTLGLGIPRACRVVELDCEDSSRAGTPNLADVDRVAEGATLEIVPVGPVGRVVFLVVEDEGPVVVAHGDCGARSGKISLFKTH